MREDISLCIQFKGFCPLVEPLTGNSKDGRGSAYFPLGEFYSTFYQIFFDFLNGWELAEQNAEGIGTLVMHIIKRRQRKGRSPQNRGEMAIGKDPRGVPGNCIKYNGL